MTDVACTRIALELAAQGRGLVSPNPMVGSVVVRDGRIVGRGFHRYDEMKHAEVWALEEAGDQARGATVYVNLEPCSHQEPGKRTPPCVKALIEAGVRRVVASMVDPNPNVNGRGFEQLRDAGIETVVGVLEEDARRLNEKFIKFVRARLPFVHLKTACSLDGRIATAGGESQWITGKEARAASQFLRGDSDAILVGIGTVLADNPLLTDRSGAARRRPLARVILDSHLRISSDSRLIQTAADFPTIIFTAKMDSSSDTDFVARRARCEKLLEFGADVIEIDAVDERLDLKAALADLGKRDYIGLLVEGGAEIAGSFVAGRLVDKVTFFIAPKLIGGRDAVPAIGGAGFQRLSEAMDLRDLSVVQRGPDWEFTGYPKYGEIPRS
jgi:diaminohydroxyphosphoribosylaminopyrimidine deaminase / 5-amino-6-(5-phosphoribosylamino)uracil reductase